MTIIFNVKYFLQILKQEANDNKLQLVISEEIQLFYNFRDIDKLETYTKTLKKRTLNSKNEITKFRKFFEKKSIKDQFERRELERRVDLRFKNVSNDEPRFDDVDDLELYIDQVNFKF
jgi:hypothetical protein